MRISELFKGLVFLFQIRPCDSFVTKFLQHFWDIFSGRDSAKWQHFFKHKNTIFVDILLCFQV